MHMTMRIREDVDCSLISILIYPIMRICGEVDCSLMSILKGLLLVTELCSKL